MLTEKEFEQRLVLRGNRVKELRQQKKLTRQELSVKSGISSKYLKIIEDGQAKNYLNDSKVKLTSSLHYVPQSFQKQRQKLMQHRLTDHVHEDRLMLHRKHTIRE